MKLIMGTTSLKKIEITLTREQSKQIRRLSKSRVNHPKLEIYKARNGDMVVFDTVIGKHENIDVAFGFTKHGAVKGIEILVYRESYGHEIRNPNWKRQFYGKNYTEHLKLDKQIRNISGATLSCAHITDAVNRLAHTWNLVLRHL